MAIVAAPAWPQSGNGSVRGAVSDATNAVVPNASVSLTDFPKTRDPLKWPFSADSFWNTPIGSGARYVAADIPVHDRIQPEEEIIVLTPTAPKVDIVQNNAGWNRNKERCESTTGKIIETNVPIPPDFSTDPGYLGKTPNQSAAILLEDGHTIIQNQPFHRCGPGGVATSGHSAARVDLYGEAIEGSHGGSGLTAIGGSIRSGELTKGGVLRHAIKLTFYAKQAFYYRADEADGKPGYRWPAIKADGYANPTTYAGTNPEVQIGSLLCLKPDYNIAALATEPARIIAKALQDYGAYIVDDAAWSSVSFEVEWGPGGRVVDEFKRTWGYDLGTRLDAGTPWANDVKDIMENLYVVANNSPAAKGGGGGPRQPKAPPFVRSAVSGQ
jgi:hypothetical protein